MGSEAAKKIMYACIQVTDTSQPQFICIIAHTIATRKPFEMVPSYMILKLAFTFTFVPTSITSQKRKL